MRTPRSTRRTAIRQPRAVLPAPYSFARRLALLADVEDLRRLGLHPEGDLHRLDGGLELRVVPARAPCCIWSSFSSRSSSRRCSVSVNLSLLMIRDRASSDRSPCRSSLLVGLLLDLVARCTCPGRRPGRKRCSTAAARRGRHARAEHDDSRAGSGSRCRGRRSATSPSTAGPTCVSPEFIISSDGS